MKISSKILSLITCLALLISLTACSCNVGSSQPYTKNGFLDTIVTITLYDSNASEYIVKCFELGKQYENMLSKTKEGSDVSKINNANGRFVEVNFDTVYLINEGKKYGDISNEAFDVSLGKLTTLWERPDILLITTLIVSLLLVPRPLQAMP